jgi:hypothetical protein
MSGSVSYNLNEVMQMAIDYNVGNLFTCMPAVVQSFNARKGTVDAKPCIKKLLADGSTIDLPTLKDIPFVSPQSSAGGLSIPIGSGDGVLLMFSQRSIDAWKAGKTDSKPNSTRKFSISDAFAIPGSIPATQKTALKKSYNEAPVLAGSKLFVGDPTKPKVGTTQLVNVDLVAILVQVLDILKSTISTGAFTSASGGPVSPLPGGPLITALVDVEAYKSALSSLVYSPSP